MLITPQLPAWAIWAGFPKPTANENFCEYVERLGLDPEPMLVGLNERTCVLANQRLASELTRQSPDLLAEYIELRRRSFAHSQ